MDQPDPIRLIAQVCFPHLLSLDDLLAVRCVCKAWRQSLSTAHCNTWRLPYSLWHISPRNEAFDSTVSTAAAAYQRTPTVLLDSGGTRPSLQPYMWPKLLSNLAPWLSAGGPDSPRNIKLHLRNLPSPMQLQAFRGISWLHTLRSQHTHSAVYSRHLTTIAALTQLQGLELLMDMPKLELRSLAQQRLRRVPLKADCLSSLVRLQRLDISCKAYTGDLLPDTLVTFSTPDVLAALSALTHLSISELALPGPWSVEQWLQPLGALQSLQLVLQDDPALCASRGLAATTSSNCSAGGAGAAAGNAGLLGTGGLSAALAAAAQAAGSSRADQQLAVAQQNLLAGLQNLSTALQQAASGGGFRSGGGASSSSHAGHHSHQHQHAAHQMSPAGPSASNSSGGAAGHAAGAAAGAAGTHLARTSSSTSTNDPDTPSASDAVAAVAVSRPLLPISFGSCCPRLKSLVLANLYGERLVKTAIPPGLTRLVLHLANPSPGPVNGEQLAAVVLQAADSLLSLELGLGMRFSLSGAVMRNLKRSLKQLRDLTLIEGAQDHLEGLGCWCNLPRLTLVEGRCTVPLRGLYELSMRAAMGRTPGVLRYHGHVRHVEELASRLGAALSELRLDSLSGLGSGYRSAAGAHSSSSGSSSPHGSQPGSPVQRRKPDDPGSDSDSATGQEQPSLPALAQLSCMTQLEVVGQQIGLLDSYGVLVLSNCKRLRSLVIQGSEPWLSADLGVKEQLEWLAELPQLRQLHLRGIMLGRSRLSAGAAAAAIAGSEPAGSTSSSSNGGGAGSSSGRKAAAGSRGSKAGGSSSQSSQGAAAPVVKGLGNGLGCGAPGSKPPAAAAATGAGTQPGAEAEAGAAEPGTAAAGSQEPPAAAAQEPAKAAVPYTNDINAAMAQTLMASAMNFSQRQLRPNRPAGVLPKEQARVTADQEASAAVCLEECRRWLCELLPNCRVWLD